MAVWTYSAWREEATDEARLTMLRRHMTEVDDAIAATVAKDGASRDANVLNAKMDRLEEQERRYMARTADTVHYVRRSRA
jgi:hypothetical protein